MNKEELIARTDKIEGWMPYEELSILYDLGMQYIHSGGVACEVGSWKGRSAFLLASICREKGARLISIDTFAGSPDQAYRTYEEALANPMKFFEENIKKNTEGLPIEFIIESSTTAHKKIQDNSLCFCFIDGDHHDPALTSDLNNFWHKMEARGVFCGHDYTSSGDTDVKVATDKKFSPFIQVKGSIFIAEKPKMNVIREAGTYCRGQRDVMSLVNDVIVPGSFEIYMEPNHVSGKPYWALDNTRLKGQFENKIKDASCVFYTQPCMKEYFSLLNPKVKLSMLAGYADFHKPYPEEEKIFDVGYIGQSVDGRGEALDYLRSYFKVYAEEHVYEDYSQRLSRCKVLFNKSRLGELNLRVYESMAIGALVTDYIEDLKYVGEEGKHFLTYKTMEEAKKKIQYLLDNPDIREQMEKDAREHFLNNHTFLHRLNSMCLYMKQEGLECKE
jgi:hypothetical protein